VKSRACNLGLAASASSEASEVRKSASTAAITERIVFSAA
jgi:hypothetical protein